MTRPPSSSAFPSQGKGVVIVGGGSGALYAVEGLREVSASQQGEVFIAKDHRLHFSGQLKW